jgi:hypothetical protein
MSQLDPKLDEEVLVLEFMGNLRGKRVEPFGSVVHF